MSRNKGKKKRRLERLPRALSPELWLKFAREHDLGPREISMALDQRLSVRALEIIERGWRAQGVEHLTLRTWIEARHEKTTGKKPPPVHVDPSETPKLRKRRIENVLIDRHLRIIHSHGRAGARPKNYRKP